MLMSTRNTVLSSSEEVTFRHEREKKAEEAEEEDQKKKRICLLRERNIGNGIQLTGPDECLEHSYESEALPGPERSAWLSKSNHYQDEVMVTDMYQLEPGLKNCKYTHIRIPVVLPTTRLNISELFRFHAMVLTSNRWHEVAADYKDNYVTYPVEDLDCFVVYARPIPVIKDVSPEGFTFVFEEDTNMKVEIPEGAVDATITIKMKRHPVDLSRIEWYRTYDPTAFQGIYALSDILTVTRVMEQSFNKNPSVEVKTNRVTESNYQVKSVQSHNRDKFSVTSTQSVSDGNEGCKMSHHINNYNSFQALFVAPEIPDSMILQAAQYGAGVLHMCSVLFFISKNPKGKWLTVELAESPDANTLVSSRKRQNYFEIQNSRVCGVYVRTNDRLRVTLGGNLVHVDRYRKLRYSTNKNSQYCFQYSPQSCNNNIHLRIEKGTCGTPYSVVEVKIVKAANMQIHFPFPESGMNMSHIKATLHGDRLDPNLHKIGNSVGPRHDYEQMAWSTCSSTSAGISAFTNFGVEGDAKCADKCLTEATSRDAVDHAENQASQVYARRGNTRNVISSVYSSSSSTGESGFTDSDAVAGANPSVIESNVIESNRGHTRHDSKVTNPTLQAPPLSILSTAEFSNSGAISGNENNEIQARYDRTASESQKGHSLSRSFSQDSGTQKTHFQSQDQVYNLAKTFPFGEQRRPTTSSTDSASEQSHPLLSDMSLLVLGSSVSLDDLHRVMVQLGTTYDQAQRSRAQADRDREDHGYVLLRHWFNRNKGKVPDRALIDKLRNAFMDSGRCDIAEKLTRVQGKTRPLKTKDFK